jgi:hypothetical protein
MAQKRSDFETIPLCRMHHREQHSIGWPAFVQEYNLDVRWWIAQLTEKPRIIISVVPIRWPFGVRDQHFYFADYRGQLFKLHPVCNGFKESWRIASALCREILISELYKERAA